MEKGALLFVFATVLMVSVAHGQDLAQQDSWQGIDKDELALQLSQDEAFRGFILENRKYLKKKDEWIASLTKEQRKAWKEGELFMPELYTEEETLLFHQQQLERVNLIKEQFPELDQLTHQQASWVRGRASDLIMKNQKE